MNMYIILHKKLRLYWPRPSNAFVINNVSSIAIEPKESILSQLSKFKTMFLNLHTLGNVYITGSVGNKQHKN